MCKAGYFLSQSQFLCRAPHGRAPGLPGDGMGLEGCVLAERGGYACPGGQVSHWSVQQGRLSYVAMAVVVSLYVLVAGVATSKRFSKVFGLLVVLFTEWVGSGLRRMFG